MFSCFLVQETHLSIPEAAWWAWVLLAWRLPCWCSGMQILHGLAANKFLPGLLQKRPKSFAPESSVGKTGSPSVCAVGKSWLSTWLNHCLSWAADTAICYPEILAQKTVCASWCLTQNTDWSMLTSLLGPSGCLCRSDDRAKLFGLFPLEGIFLNLLPAGISVMTPVKCIQ